MLRFFSDDTTFRILPGSNPDYVRNGPLFREELANHNEGDSFRSAIFRQLA